MNGAATRWGGIGLAAVLLLTGCAGRKVLPSSSAPVTELHLLNMPVALNMDAEPGADGFVSRIYGGNPKFAKPVPIREGTLEVLMFDGVITNLTTNNIPLRIWPFSPAQLRPFEVESSIGVGYNLTLFWQTNRPREDRITVVARYRNDNLPSIYSTLSYLSVVSK